MSLYLDIEKHFRDFHLEVKLECGRETLALLGASGCGKSLTLKCIAGIVTPDRGIIRVDDQVVFDSEKRINLPPQQRSVGLMFQNYALFPNMTVRENIAAGANREKNRKKRQAIAETIMAQFGLGSLGDHYPSQLSGGQQQRVALARMLVSAPKVVLLDEPFSALDSHLRFRLEGEIKGILREYGKTVLLVSHDQDEVFRMADKTAIMAGGRLETLDTVQGVFRDPKTKNGALLTGCKNLSAMEPVSPHTIRALDWGLTLQVPQIPEGANLVGIRMHSLVPGEGPNSCRCRVADVIENPFSHTIMLMPPQGRTAIGWELEKERWEQMAGEELTVSLPPQELLLLKDEIEVSI